MLNIYSRVLKLDNGAAVDAGLIGRLGQLLHVAEKGRVQCEDTPMDAKLRVFCL
jgi:hypothetical protein